MKKFTIYSNEYLSKKIQGYYHEDYHGGGNWKIEGTIENIVVTLKNTYGKESNPILNRALQGLSRILYDDLYSFQKDLTICIIPRSKAEKTYSPSQLLFKKLIKYFIKRLNFNDGSDYIIRHTNTRTTHMNRSGHGGDGDMPYIGISQDTCYISQNVKGKNILLIDDLYTKTVNIDEDMIQALLNSGAKSVKFYAVGKTVYEHA